MDLSLFTETLVCSAVHTPHCLSYIWLHDQVANFCLHPYVKVALPLKAEMHSELGCVVYWKCSEAVSWKKKKKKGKCLRDVPLGCYGLRFTFHVPNHGMGRMARFSKKLQNANHFHIAAKA